MDLDHRRRALYKELAALECETERAESIGSAGLNGGCFPSAGSLDRGGYTGNIGGLSQACDKSAPTPQGEISSLADAIYGQTEALHRELSYIEQRFASVLRPADPQNKTGQCAPVLTTLGGRLYDGLQCLNAAIARLQAIQELACL